MNDLTLKIATGKSEKSSAVENLSVTWGKFLERLSVPKVQPGERSYIIPGWCEGGIRNAGNVRRSSVAIIDIDDKAGSSGLRVEDLAGMLDFTFPYLWALYTTRSYDGGNACCRLVVPFAGEIGKGGHAAAVKELVTMLPDEWRALVDGVSYLPHQAMFLPCVKAEGDPFAMFSGGGKPYPASGGDEGESESECGIEDAVSALPLDLSDDEIAGLLSRIDPNTLSYGLDEGVFGWGNVIAALSHQYQGKDEGLRVALKWSSLNTEKHDEKVTRSKYKSFLRGRGGRTPITFASVIKYVKELEESPEGRSGLVERLIHEAKKISSMEDYFAFQEEIKAYSMEALPKDGRAMIAAAVAAGFGKEAHLTKTEVKTALTPRPKGKAMGSVDGKQSSLPDWIGGWCYITATNEFYHIPSRYRVNKEAFNAIYDRENECLEEELSASVLALRDWGISTYSDTMYWPGAGEVIEHKSLFYVNSYRDDRIKTRAAATDEEADAVFAVEDHFRNLISNDDDRAILLDWLTYVYNNPGKRVHWSPVLQGGEGAGKSFINRMMTALMGSDNSSVLGGSVLNSNYTDWGTGRTLYTVEEVRISGGNKYESVDRLKPFLTNNEVMIEEKFRSIRVVPNFTNYLFLTNFKDAIPISEHGRRYAVIYSDIQTSKDVAKLGDGYFERLFDAIGKYPECVGHWLSTRVLAGGFDPKGHAPITSCYEAVLAISETSTDDDFIDVIDNHRCEVINDKIIDATHLYDLRRSSGDVVFRTRTLRANLLKAGYSPIPLHKGRVWIPKFKKRHLIWYKGDEVSTEKVLQIVHSFFDKYETNGNF